MAFGPILQAVQEQVPHVPQALPLPHEDYEYIDQRFQAQYYTSEGNWEIISIDWNTRQHRVVVVENQQRSFIDVQRHFQITLQEVLELKNIILYRIKMVNVHGHNIQDGDAILNQSVEDMQLASATIWSHEDPEGLPLDQDFIHQLPEAAWEAAG